jgi:hypothetical protein
MCWFTHSSLISTAVTDPATAKHHFTLTTTKLITQCCGRIWQFLTRSYQPLWSQNIRYRLHKSQQLQNTLSQMNSLQAGTLRSILILSFHLFLVSQVGSECDFVLISHIFDKSMAVHTSHTLRLLVTTLYAPPLSAANTSSLLLTAMIAVSPLFWYCGTPSESH